MGAMELASRFPCSIRAALRSVRRCRRRAVTLAEVLIAMTIATVVGLATIGMLSATSYGSTSQLGMRKLLVVHRTTAARVNHAIRTSVELVDVDPSGLYLVVWVDDANDDGTKQYGELQLIERDTTANELRSFRDTADTTAYTDLATFRTFALANYTPERWATGITAADFEKVTPVGSEAMLVNFRITATRDEISDTAVGAVAVRNATPTP